MLGMSGISKVMGTEEMIKNFTFTNLLPYLTLVGVSEIVGVGLLIYPKTSKYGALILSSIMSAAAVIHLSYMGGNGVMIPVLLGLLAWTGHCLREYGNDIKTLFKK
jgi:uncharacterized membrane protein YphA (DoxX/SURF4 family)